ncbi:MAG: 50S ribosomal protein L25 [Chloroflexota bacterium]|nr:MAG: 50S ribosomal protein L25 [Chloroflexota bacterium]
MEKMEKYILDADKRVVIGKQVKALRREGKLPAVIYGQEIEPMPITLNTKQVHQVLKVVGANTLISIKVGKDEFLTLVREIQREVIMRDLLHMDFQAVSLEETITTFLPVVMVGESPAVTELEGLLILSMEELQIEAKAKDLPDTISVDVSGLMEIGDNILVKDLVISGDVTILDDPDGLVIVATAPVLMDEIVDEVEEGAELFEELTDAELLEGVEGEAGEEGEEEEAVAE